MYTQFYSFSEKPFNLTPDPKFLYLSPSHREALASMIYGIDERKGFISITGEVGTGKTTLVYTLLDNLNEKVNAVSVYHTTVTFEQLLENILLELDVPISDENKSSLLHKLNEYLVKKLSPEETLAIIIDEAQNLPKELLEEFRMLSNLETSKSKLLQILLVGQPELDIKLNSKELRQLKQRIAIRRQIKPLTPKECREYIEHRLSLVNSSSSKIFTAEAISLIVKYANGIPRNINILCDNAFLIGYSLSKKKIDAKIIKEVIEDMKDYTEEAHPPSTLEYAPPPSSSKHAFSFKSLVLPFISIIFLLSLLIFIIDRGFFRDGNILQFVKIKKDSAKQLKEIPTSTHSIEKVSDHPIIATDPQPETQKKPSQKEPTLSVEKGAHRVVLKEGESLYSLALKRYQRADETLFDLILQANPTITDVRAIHDNQEITMPVITPESYIKEASDGTYHIYIGTFETFELANLYSNKVVDLGKRLTIEPHKFSPKDIWYRVTMSSFNSKEEALKKVSLLKEKAILNIP